MATATRKRAARTAPVSVQSGPLVGTMWTMKYASARNPGDVHITTATLVTFAGRRHGNTDCSCPGTEITGDCWHRDEARKALRRHGVDVLDGETL